MVGESIRCKRTQGFTADPDYWKGEVFVYVGSIQNLKDLKARCTIMKSNQIAIL